MFYRFLLILCGQLFFLILVADCHSLFNDETFSEHGVDIRDKSENQSLHNLARMNEDGRRQHDENYTNKMTLNNDEILHNFDLSTFNSDQTISTTTSPTALESFLRKFGFVSDKKDVNNNTNELNNFENENITMNPSDRKLDDKQWPRCKYNLRVPQYQTEKSNFNQFFHTIGNEQNFNKFNNVVNKPEINYNQDDDDALYHMPTSSSININKPGISGIYNDDDHHYFSTSTSISLDNKDNKATYWCSKYRSECETREDDLDGLRSRIIGGRPASPRVHTHMVMIGYGNVEDKHWLCGGTLITADYVLSAAHCTTAGRWGKARWARVGELDLSTRSDDARPQERMITGHHIHPDYKEPAVYNDIALFKLNQNVTINQWVSPICLQTTKDIDTEQVLVTGWGRTDFAAETSPILMEVEIGLYNISECKKLMDRTGGNKLPDGIDSKTMICAGVSQGGKDACSGDSGGPLLIHTTKCVKTQIGITSIGRECGLPNSPGIYTKVSHYVPWIESIVWR